MPKAKTKPMSEARRREVDFGAVGLSEQAARLSSMSTVQVIRAGATDPDKPGQKAAHDKARRTDCFDELRAGMNRTAPGAYDAVRDMERLLLVARGEGDRGRSLQRVDCDGGKDRTDAMVDASRELQRLRARAGDRAWWLLNELLEPADTKNRGFTSWRQVVQHITGETHTHAQAAAVRAAAASLLGTEQRRAA